MGFFGSLWNGVKKIGKKVWDSRKTIGKAIVKGLDIGKKVVKFAKALPVVGKYASMAEAPLDAIDSVAQAGNNLIQKT